MHLTIWVNITLLIMVRASHGTLENYWLCSHITFAYHLSLWCPVVKAFHLSSDYWLYRCKTFAQLQRPWSSMVRLFCGLSEGYGPCDVILTLNLSPGTFFISFQQPEKHFFWDYDFVEHLQLPVLTELKHLPHITNDSYPYI